MRIERTGIMLQDAAESSWFIWGGEKYYVFTDRDAVGTSRQMKIVRFSDNTVISTFGTGYGCQDAVVQGGTLYVFATNCFMDFSHAGNSIVRFSTTNLTTWSSPTTIYTAESQAQIYNLSVVKNPDQYTIAYEIHRSSGYSAYFNIRFLQSLDATTWISNGTDHILADQSCPDLHWSDGKYYIFTGHRSNTVVSSTNDLFNFSTSRLPVLKPIYEFEDDHTSDPDLIEDSGKVYILYSVNDQSTYMRETYATYNGTMAQLLSIYPGL